MPRNFKPALICEMKSVESSQFREVGYIRENDMIGYLFINFSQDSLHKSLYLYHPISPKMYEDMMNSESKGSYFAANIKNNENITCIKVPT